MCSDQGHSDGLLQDALLKIQIIADSLQNDEVYMTHWKAASALAQRLREQRKVALDPSARRREMTSEEFMKEGSDAWIGITTTQLSDITKFGMYAANAQGKGRGIIRNKKNRMFCFLLSTN